MTASEGTTASVAGFVAETPVPPDAAAAATALCENLSGLEAAAVRDQRAAVGYWVACALLHHAGSADAFATESLAAGLEPALRVRDSLDGHVVGGWDPVCAAVLVGSACAAARHDGLDGEATARAVGIAATQASGLEILSGTLLGTFQRRLAACNGLEAARLAGAGMTAPVTGLEGRRGLYALMAPTADPAAAADRLGRRWLVTALPTEAGRSRPPGAEARRPDPIEHATEALS
ncbi:MmgE/PrpD family protein [Spirillospora sp. NPDC049024]